MSRFNDILLWLYTLYDSVITSVPEQIAGLVATALLVYLPVQAYRLLVSARLQFKYRISGAYISIFEDFLAGSKRINISNARIRQWRRVHIRDWFQDEKKAWKLTGDISNKGFLLGTYGAESRADLGKGGFALRINSRNLLSGVWAGYANEAAEMQSGRYFLLRRTTGKIEPITLDHAESMNLITSTQRQEVEQKIGPSSFQTYFVRSDYGMSCHVVGVAAGRPHCQIQIFYSYFDKATVERAMNIYILLDQILGKSSRRRLR
jgi:hypothetical protein